MHKITLPYAKFILLFFFIFLATTHVIADGTKQAMPDPSNGVAMYITDDGSYGPYLNAPASQRLQFRITDFTTEKLYFGVNPRERSGNPAILSNRLFYQIKDPSGTVVFGPFRFTTAVGDAGYIDTYSKAVAGPNIGGATPSGYNPIVFDPSTITTPVNGDYYIEIYKSGDSGATRTTDGPNVILPYFDFTVGTTAGTTFEGRVFSRKWGFITYNPTNFVAGIGFDFKGKFFAYTDDQFVVQVDFQENFRPFGYQLSMNKFGVVNDDNDPGNVWVDTRGSISYGNPSGNARPDLENGYPVFITKPDPDVFPLGETTKPVLFGNIYGCPGQYFIPIKLEEAADVSITIDLNGTPGFQTDTEDVILEAFDQPAGNIVIEWDGDDGLGNPVSGNTNTSVKITSFRGRTNVPMDDAELNLNGLSIQALNTDTNGNDVLINKKIYWDDRNVQVTTNNSTNGGVSRERLDEGLFGPAHKWNGPNPTDDNTPNMPAPANGGGNATTSLNDDFGNERILNTWFYGDEAESPSYSIKLPSCELDGDGVADDVDIDDDNDGILDTVELAGFDPDGDADNDGVPDYIDPQFPGFTDSNGDGVDDRFDFDLDGIINSFDLDSDNDGIPDNIEAQPTTVADGFTLPNNDAGPGNNGLDSAYTGGINPQNSDGEGNPDYLDLDSDNGGGNDTVEAGLDDTGGTLDTDRDGLLDQFENGTPNDGYNINDTITDPFDRYPDQDGDVDSGGDVDYRDNLQAPVNTVPGDQTVDEDAATAITGISTTDVDGNLATTQLTVTNGTITVDLSGGATISAGANGSADLTLSGTEAEINAALATISYQGDTNFNGTDTLTMISTDSDGTPLSDTDTIAITVNPINDTPVAGDDISTTNPNVPVTISVLSNDEDVDGDVLTVTRIVTQPTNGTVTINGDGSITYTPNPDFMNGTDTFEYEVCDGSGSCDTASVSVSVPATALPPTANPDSNTVLEDTTLSVDAASGLLSNDTDPNGDALTVTMFEVEGVMYTAGTTVDFTEGSITINADGSYEFIPIENFNGNLPQITYTIDDGNAGTDTGTLDITVDPVNDAPVNTVPGGQTVDENIAITITGISTTDVDGNLATTQLTVNNGTVTVDLSGGATVSAGANGSADLTLSGTEAQINAALATVSYQGDENFNGNDTLTIISTDSDGTPLSDTDTVAITVDPVNDAPVNTVPGDQTVDEDVATAITGISTTDVDGNLATTQLTVDNGTITVDLSGGATVSAGSNGSADLTLSGTEAEINAALATVSYQGDANFNGTDTLTIVSTDSDSTPLSDADAIAITVNPINDAPVAGDDISTTDPDVPVTIPVLPNDSDIDGDDLTVTRIVTQPTNGTVMINGDGTITYTPNPGFMNGTDTFEYEVCDGSGSCDTASVSVSVPATALPPTANPDSNTVLEDTTLSVDAASGLLSNDTDPNGDALTVTMFEVEGVMYTAGTTVDFTEGSITINADGSYEFIPIENFNGNVPQISYTIDDGNGGTDIGTLDITVDPVNDAPVAINDVYTVTENNNLTLNPLNQDTDIDGDLLSIESINGIAITPGTAQTIPVPNGIVTVTASGRIIFTPDTDFIGLVSFPYVITDGTVTATADQTIEVQLDTDGDGDPDINDPDDDNDGNPDTTDPNPLTPTTADDLLTLINGTTGTVNVLDNDDFLPGTNTTIVDLGTGTAAGTVTFDPLTGEMTYVPANGEGGTTVTVNYQVCHTAVTPAVCEIATVTITIEDVDSDNDGIPDVDDLDDDNDGIPDTVELGDDPARDTDGDGIIDSLDLDADGDGISDLVESGNEGLDANGDGQLDGPFGSDGIADDIQDIPDNSEVNYTLIDTDGDGILDFQDIDDDGDGVNTAEEDIDEDGDPTNDDTDGDNIPDYLDIDDDGDGIATIDENPDNDGDGDPSTGNTQDTDGDGIADYLDTDDDGDGIDTVFEDIDGDGDPTNDDSDGDGIANYLDRDDDGDGINTDDESSDPNGDGNPDDAADADADGIPDYLEENNADPNAEDGVEVFNVVTPNGDGDHDVLIIRNLDQFPDNELKIFNRWGVLVYDARGYGQNGEFFRGESNGRVTINQDKQLPVGTYFYVLTYKTDDGQTKKRSDYLYINR